MKASGKSKITRRCFLKIGSVSLAGAAVYRSFPFGADSASASEKGKRVLVIYFSVPETDNPNNMTEEENNSTVIIDGKVLGNTQYMAYLIRDTIGANADIFRIEPETPYTTDHKKLIEQATDEQRRKYRPPLKAKIENLDQYDLIFLGYPTWWYELPMVLYTFLEEHNLAGKTIIPFNTHGGSGFASTISVIEQLQPSATVRKDGMSISRDRIQNAKTDIVNWVNKLIEVK